MAERDDIEKERDIGSMEGPGGAESGADIHLTRTEARGGSSNHMTRYILPISLGLVVLLFVLLLVIYR